MIPDKDRLKDLVWLRTGKNPERIWNQGLLIVAEFEDGSRSVHRLEQLEMLGQ